MPTPDPALIPTPADSETSLLEDDHDLSLIRWMLSLTPTQRLEVLQGFLDGVWALRNGKPS
jgi:hypothetical protein